MRKYRHELKFIITPEIARILKKRLELIMDIDENSTNNNTYFIRSLYFDDINSKSYYDKLDGVEYRKKYRIRYYNHDESFIKLECKYKHGSMTSKDNQIISKEVAKKIVNGDIYDIIDNENNLLSKFITEYKTNGLKPSIIVDYYRTALIYPILDVRVTFDSFISSGKYNYDLFDDNIVKVPVLEKSEEVLEVKFNEIIPEHIEKILSTVPSIRQSVSKFTICRSIK